MTTKAILSMQADTAAQSLKSFLEARGVCVALRGNDCSPAIGEEEVIVTDTPSEAQKARQSGTPCIVCTWCAEEKFSAEVMADSEKEVFRFLSVGMPAARLLTVLKRRRSIRRFAERPVEEEKLETLLSAALLAPTSRDFRPVEYIAVTKRETLDALSECKAAGADMLKTAPLAIVLSAREEKSDVWLEDSALAAIVLQLMAEELGLSSCWVQIYLRKDENGGNAEENVDKVLGLPPTRRCACIVAIGYRAEEKEPNTAPDLSSSSRIGRID